MNKQMKLNIKQLDAQIGRLTKELEGMKDDNRYEIKVRKIEDLTTLRTAIVSKDGEQSGVSKEVVEEVDRQILELAKELVDLELNNEYLSKMKQLDDLTKIRTQLNESMIKGSSKDIIIQGAISVTAMVIMLKYEEKDVITSKAINMVIGMFRGK